MSLLMCMELPGCVIGRSRDVVIFYLAIHFGRNVSPANFAIFGGTISCLRDQFGMGRPDWFLPIPFLSKLYVDDGLLFDIRNEIRQQANVLMWEAITVGLLGRNALKLTNLKEEGQWSTTHTMLGFDIDSSALEISLPEAKVAGPRAIFDQISEKSGPRALEVGIFQKIRCHIDHFRDSNAIWEFLAGPSDFIRRYTAERAAWANFQVPEAWDSFWNSMSVVFDLMHSEGQWRKIPLCSLVRLLTPGRRLSIHLGRISPRFIPDRFVWASVDAALELLGCLSGGGSWIFSRPDQSRTSILSVAGDRRSDHWRV